MRNLFFCSTQYQLISAANIAGCVYPNDNNEIVIVGCIAHIRENLVNNAEQIGCFSKVYLMKTGPVNGNVWSYCCCIVSLLFPSSLNATKIQTDRVFIVATEIYSRIAACYLLQKKRANELFYFEEGVGSYAEILRKCEIYNASNKRLKYRFGFYLAERCQGMFLYCPELIGENHLEIPIYEIPNIVVGSAWAKSLYKALSDTESHQFASGDVLLFDTLHIDDSTKKLALREIEIANAVFGNGLIVKPHPSDPDPFKSDSIRVLQNSQSMEILNLLHSFDDKILIAYNSTAVLSPKIIFGEEPTIIILYKLDKKHKNDDCKLFFEKIEKIYVNKERFYMPNTLDEFKEILERLKTKK